MRSNKITINTAEYFAIEASNVLPSFYVLISLSFQRWWENQALVWQSHSITFTELLILIMWNALLTQMEFVLSNFIVHRTILNLFMFNIILEQTLLCAMVKVMALSHLTHFVSMTHLHRPSNTLQKQPFKQPVWTKENQTFHLYGLCQSKGNETHFYISHRQLFYHFSYKIIKLSLSNSVGLYWW